MDLRKTCFAFYWKLEKLITPSLRFSQAVYEDVLARLVPRAVKLKLIWLLEGRQPEDVFPTHYRVNTEQRIRALAERVGFELEAIRLIASTPLSVMLPPLVVFELLLIRLSMTEFARSYRTDIIAVLTKPAASS